MADGARLYKVPLMTYPAGPSNDASATLPSLGQLPLSDFDGERQDIPGTSSSKAAASEYKGHPFSNRLVCFMFEI
jgi:hypothetical protein